MAKQVNNIDTGNSIPNHWQIVRLKNICIGKMQYGINVEADKYAKTGVRFLRTTDIDGEGNIYPEGIFLKSEDVEDNYYLKKGDLLFSRSGTIGRCYLHNSNETFCYAGFLVRFRPNDYLHAEWCYYYSFSPQFKQQVFSAAIETTISNFNGTKYANIYVPIPTQEEEQRIVNHIRKQSEKINHFIQKKQQFIELLQEQKNIVAFEKIHHEGHKNGYPLRRIKSFSKILRGKFTHRPRNDVRLYGGVFPFIQTGEVSQANKFINSYSQTLNEWGYSVSKEFPKGTICLTIAANVGDVAILNFDACFPDSIVGILPNEELHADYLYYALKSLKNRFLSEATLTTQYNLNVERISPIKIPVPNIETQIEIARGIEEESLLLDKAISKAEKEIELIKEYKQSMIAEAVMGKLNL